MVDKKKDGGSVGSGIYIRGDGYTKMKDVLVAGNFSRGNIVADGDAPRIEMESVVVMTQDALAAHDLGRILAALRLPPDSNQREVARLLESIQDAKPTDIESTEKAIASSPAWTALSHVADIAQLSQVLYQVYASNLLQPIRAALGL